jgi:hypothetical protein
MADERTLELLDDYLTNRMGEQDRSAFEQQLQADPDLQNEYALQQRLIKGIRDARVSQLKSMLNQVPVPANNTGSALASKIIFGAVLTMMVVATAWYLTRDQVQPVQQKTSSEQNVTPQEPVLPAEEPVVQQEATKDESIVAKKQVIESDKNQTSAGTEHSKPSLARKPDPLEAPADKRPEPSGVAVPTVSSLAVETDGDNKRYSFHYQFSEGKLLLYGPFDENLYQIIELPTDSGRAAHLFYKDQYYSLNLADSSIRPLQPVSDPALLQRLKEYRPK